MKESTRNEIIRLYYGGTSMRKIADALHVSRHTVKRALTEHDGGRSGESPPSRRKRPSQLDAYEATVRALLERYPEITAMRVLEELRKEGFSGGYTIVKERVGQLRPHRRKQPVMRFETSPGAQAQMDYATYTIDFTEEGPRRVHLFSYILGYSRRQYIRFVERQDFATTIRQHVRAFEHLGGVAATCLYDNMKVVVTEYDGEEPIYNTRFLAFATHYGFRPWACRPRRPQTKGKVERPFYFVETSLLNGRTFRSLDHLSEVAAWWLANVADVRIHRETKQTPLARHKEELPHLVPLPQNPYDTAEVVYRTVNCEGLIAYRGNRYTVPWRSIGQMLPIRITESELIVHGPHLDEIARHRLFPMSASGQTSRREEDCPQEDSRKKHAVLKERFEQLGPSAARFFTALTETRRYGKQEAYKILTLLETYRREDLVTALEHAARHGAYSSTSVERILAIQAAPRTALDRLAEREQGHLRSLMNDLPTRPRDTAEYQHLLEGQTSKGTPDGEDAAKDDTTIDAEETEDDRTDAPEQDP